LEQLTETTFEFWQQHSTLTDWLTGWLARILSHAHTSQSPMTRTRFAPW
jgi:hypothetical protein